MGCRAIEMSRRWDITQKKCRANDANPFFFTGGLSISSAEDVRCFRSCDTHKTAWANTQNKIKILCIEVLTGDRISAGIFFLSFGRVF